MFERFVAEERISGLVAQQLNPHDESPISSRVDPLVIQRDRCDVEEDERERLATAHPVVAAQRLGHAHRLHAARRHAGHAEPNDRQHVRCGLSVTASTVVAAATAAIVIARLECNSSI